MDKKARLLLTRKLPEAVETAMARDYDLDRNAEDRLYDSDELIRRAEGRDAIVPCHTEHLARDVIGRLPDSVRLIANYSVGYNHVDVAAAAERGIVVTNTPDVLSDATAEIAMLLMLGAARRAAEGERLVREGTWKDWSPQFMVGTQITGKRLGIVGMGRVGRVFAKRARGFDMEIHYHNRRPLDLPDAEAATYHADLESLLSISDVISLHCPATPETEGLVDRAFLDQLPRHAILVNAARGNLVNDEALITALQEKRIAAAGLDVFANEPNCDPRYRGLWNSFLLPHIGSATHETRDAMGFRALANIDAFFAGREPGDRVA